MVFSWVCVWRQIHVVHVDPFTCLDDQALISGSFYYSLFEKKYIFVSNLLLFKKLQLLKV